MIFDNFNNSGWMGRKVDMMESIYDSNTRWMVEQIKIINERLDRIEEQKRDDQI